MTQPNPPSLREGESLDGPADGRVLGQAAGPIVAVGASAGGLEAFTRFLKPLPADTGMAFVLIQHLSPDRPSPLVSLLSKATSMPVIEGADGLPVEPNRVYVIPPGTEMALSDGHLTIKPRSKERVPHRPIDVFFQSLAGHEAGAIGIVLSGADSDGTLGLRAIKAGGGMTFAQDESARVFGMPRSGIASGYVDLVLPPEEMAKEIVHLATMPEVLHTPDAMAEHPEPLPSSGMDDDASFRAILHLLRITTGVDFAHYKQTTVRRRILRRMALGNVPNVQEFLRNLRDNPSDLSALHDDILIHVTTFFRDPEVFEVLAREVFPRMIHDRQPSDAIRVWVPGCATGEEAFSIAMVLLEALAQASSSITFQIFGTDVSSLAIDRAREGVYAEASVAEVSSERLRRFFVKLDRGYQISKAVRDLCIFAKHDLTRDPPFSKLDLISCRNVLIYLDTELQNRIIPLLHYALKPAGYLLLGTSETVGEHGDLLKAVDAHHKLYVKGGGSSKQNVAFPTDRSLPEQRDVPRARADGWRGFDVEKEADRILVNSYAPPGVIVNEKLEILHFRGQTAPYLRPAPGKASFNLLAMAREGLLAELSSAVRQAREERVPVKVRDLRVLAEGSIRECDLEVIPLGATSPGEGFLILFQAKLGGAMASSSEGRPTPPGGTSDDEMVELQKELTRVRRERDSLRQQLQSVIDDEGAYNEELQSANEEVLSSNEELQSVNEELETAKEELQSTNEELSTVNDELQGRNAVLNELNDDLSNLLASVAIPIVMLGPDLRIRRFTPTAQTLFSLINSDIGRPISDINIRVTIPDLEPLCNEAIGSMSVTGREVQGRDGHWYLLRVHPYRTRENKIDGAVIVLLDVDVARRALLQSEEARDYAEAIIATVREPLAVLDGMSRIRSVNRAFLQAFQVSKAEVEGVLLDDARMAEWGIPHLRGVLEQVRASGLVEDHELTHELHRMGKRTLLLNARRIERSSAEDGMMLLAIEDVTERKRIERELKERVEEAEALLASDRRKDDFLAMLAHELRNPMTPIVNAVSLIRNKGAQAEPFSRELGIIARQVQRLVRIIDDLLDVARITRGAVELRKERVDIATIVHASIESIRPLSETRRHQLRVTVPGLPVLVEVDPVRMEQVFTNLLNNAIKYTEPGGLIEVTCERTDATVTVRIRDNGMGIKQEMLSHVFDLFAQEQLSIARTGGGLGIGLTIVRQLVEMHGGHVEVSSEGRGRGSEFSVLLPRLPDAQDAPSRTQAAGVSNGSATAPAGLRTLVVEDNEDVLETLALLLGDWGCDVQVARNGPDALDAAPSFGPQVVLLDLGLPGMDGYEVARRLRSTPATRDARLIAMSGYGQAQDKRLSKEVGFDQHLVKPVDPGRLKQVLMGEDVG